MKEDMIEAQPFIGTAGISKNKYVTIPEKEIPNCELCEWRTGQMSQGDWMYCKAQGRTIISLCYGTQECYKLFKTGKKK